MLADTTPSVSELECNRPDSRQEFASGPVPHLLLLPLCPLLCSPCLQLCLRCLTLGLLAAQHSTADCHVSSFVDSNILSRHSFITHANTVPAHNKRGSADLSSVSHVGTTVAPATVVPTWVALYVNLHGWHPTWVALHVKVGKKQRAHRR